MKETEVPHPAPGEDVDVVEVPLERVRPLDPEERADRAVRPRRLEVRRRPHEADGLRVARDRRVERVDLLVRRLREPARLFAHRDTDEAEELRPHSAVDHSRHIDVTADGGAGERRLVPHEKVVAEPAAPHQRVRVEIDRRMRRMDGSRLAENPCASNPTPARLRA